MAKNLTSPLADADIPEREIQRLDNSIGEYLSTLPDKKASAFRKRLAKSKELMALARKQTRACSMMLAAAVTINSDKEYKALIKGERVAIQLTDKDMAAMALFFIVEGAAPLIEGFASISLFPSELDNERSYKRAKALADRLKKDISSEK